MKTDTDSAVVERKQLGAERKLTEYKNKDYLALVACGGALVVARGHAGVRAGGRVRTASRLALVGAATLAVRSKLGSDLKTL